MKSLKITDQLHSICLVDRRNTCQRILYLRHVILFRFLSQNIGWFVLQRKIGFQVSRSFSFTSGNDQCKLTVNTQLGNLFFFFTEIYNRVTNLGQLTSFNANSKSSTSIKQITSRKRNCFPMAFTRS